MFENLPNPRTVSNVVGPISKNIKGIKNGANQLFVQFSQFINYDMIRIFINI
jgi:hypothetical protein